MSWLDGFFTPRPALAPAQRARLERWRALPAAGLDDASARYVVVDVESSGPDPRRDALIAIGALALVDGLLAPPDAFAAILRQEAPSPEANILVHGIGAGAQRTGLAPAEALLGFLDYAGKAPLVGYHAFFDQAMLERALRAELGLSFRAPWIDLAWALPELFPEKIDRKAGLDEWLAVFGLAPIRRHDAVSDAFSAAQLLQIALGRAGAAPRALIELEARRRRRLGWITPPGVASGREATP